MDKDFIEKLNLFLLNNKHNHFTNQSKVCLRVIERIYRRVNDGFYFGDVKVDLNESLIIDGNHRYIAYSLANIEFGLIPSVKNFCDNFPYKETKTEYLNSLSEIKKGSVKWQKDKLFETASKFRKEEVDKELPKLSDYETETIFKEFTYATIDYEVALVFKDPETIKRSRDNYANALKKINPVFLKFDENPFSEDAIQSMAFYKSYLEGKISEIIRLNEEYGN